MNQLGPANDWSSSERRDGTSISLNREVPCQMLAGRDAHQGSGSTGGALEC